MECDSLDGVLGQKKKLHYVKTKEIKILWTSVNFFR